ncbi:MAG: FHA domain-containing protein, partial [Phycisphaerae bacterium]|nr:FHA domain-containing protein [Phycisphaerae bacterium]
MRLVVKQNGGGVSELRFTSGPIHIGRGAESQIFLPNTKVSRQHAVIFSTPNGDWMLQDLDSANKTYLNDNPIHKAKIKTGDRIRIADFTIEI